MSQPQHGVGDTMRVHFVWRQPEGDFLRAVFEAEVLHLDATSEKYVLRLIRLAAARQESPDGEGRGRDSLSREDWARVVELVGKRITLAYEVQDGRPLWLRWSTLTGEHNFFRRLNELPPALTRKLTGEEPESPSG
jgi:hypothetical protein